MLKVIDMAAAKGTTNPKDKIICKYYKNHHLVTRVGTLKDAERYLDFEIRKIIRLNFFIKVDIIDENEMLSEEEKKKNLLLKKNN